MGDGDARLGGLCSKLEMTKKFHARSTGLSLLELEGS